MEASSVTLPVTAGVRAEALTIELLDEATNCGDTSSITLPEVAGVRAQALSLDVVHYSLPSKVSSLTLPAVGGVRTAAIDLDVYDLTCVPGPTCEPQYWFYGVNPLYEYTSTFDEYGNMVGNYEEVFRMSDHEHGYSSDDVADGEFSWSWMNRVWLGKIACHGPYEAPAYSANGSPIEGKVNIEYQSKFTYLNHHDMGSANLVGALSWVASSCSYISEELDPEDPQGVYILKGEDSVNGKWFEPEGSDGKYVLVDEPTAPTLTLPDGTIRYSIKHTTLNPYNGSYSPRSFGGDTVFLDIDDTTLESTGYVPYQWAAPNVVGNTLAVPSWFDANFTANTISVLPAYVTPENTEWSNNLEWSAAGFTCSESNQYGV